MAAPLLLVADDLATIAAVKRVLAREGYEVVLATNAADAIIAWGHHTPGLVLLQPSVESERGAVVLEELQAHPDAGLLRVVLLGETLPGFGLPVEPLPIDPEHFANTIEENLRSGGAAAQDWQLDERRTLDAPEPETEALEPEAWRATGPPEPMEAPEPVEVLDEPQEPPQPLINAAELEQRLFNDLPGIEEELHRDVEAEAIATVETSLRRSDAELQHLEDEVRAEAQRRRAARQSAAPPPEPPPSAELPPNEPGTDAESSFAELASPSDASAQSEGRAKELLGRAEAMVLEGRAVSDSRRRSDDTETRRSQSELEALRRRAENIEELLRREREGREAAEAELSAARTELSTSNEYASNLQAEVERASAETTGLQAELQVSQDLAAQLEAQLQESQGTVGELQQSSQELSGQLQAAGEWQRELQGLREQAAELEVRLGEESEARAAADVAHLRVEQERAEAEQARAELTAQHQALSREHEELHTRLQTALDAEERRTEELSRATEQLGAAHEERDALRARAEQAEAISEQAQERVAELQRRATMPLSLPGRKPLGVPRSGAVDLEGLARLVGQLVIAEADARLELGAPGGTRTVWFKRGQLIGAESTFERETVVDRARRDGLIDARQENELRLLRTATPSEQLDALKTRGFIREIEVVPLVQRFTEQLALEALGEPNTQYRLADEAPGTSVLVAGVPRATMPLLAEALRRALPVEALLERLGGGGAVVVPRDAELDVRHLGFSDRERKMLSWVNGEASVEDLSLASALKQETAFRALLVAKILGIIDLEPPQHAGPTVSPNLDVKRLEAKYEEIQEADYFAVLGVTRTAGTEEVQRAFERLSNEFDPLKYSAHPDAGLQQRAQVVHTALEEAARALEDERRRAEYARHLLD